MKYIQFYQRNKISENEVFDSLISSLKSSVKVWDYFINWDKVNRNIKDINIELNLLNSLIGSSNLEEDFISLIKKYPNTAKVIPFLLAVRETEFEILRDYKNRDLSYLNFDFKSQNQITDEKAREYFLFIEKSGLIELFLDKKIKNFVDYVFGVEVGLDSNGRKNRGGTLMEELVEVFLKQSIEKNNDLECIPQATPSRIQQKWNYTVKFDISARSFDFAVFNKKTRKLFLFETNFYNGGGSKLKSVCGEFKSLFNELQKQNIELIWITDGKGWLTAKRPLEETFNNNNYLFNISLIEKGVLDEILILK
ncbi:MAG: type II restriction endonuclease [Candidatus Methanoperedens sp.]